MKMEMRAVGEVTEVGEGFCEAYLTRWGVVDSYNTQFERGAFVDSFDKRGVSGVRLIWNHQDLCGKIEGFEEDEYGPKVKVKFNLDTRAGQEAFSHVKAGDVNCFSFGFNSVSSVPLAGGVRSIRKVDIMECGPVVFQANDEAKIVGVRGTEFDTTYNDAALREEGYKLMNALNRTIDDIFWSDNIKADEAIAAVDTCISTFHMRYLDWLNQWYAKYETREGSAPRHIANQIQHNIDKLDTAKLVLETALTEDDIDCLKRGMLLPYESRGKLSLFPEEFVEGYKLERRKIVEALCDELRSGGFAPAEQARFSALLSIHEAKTNNEESKSEISKALDFLTKFQASLN